MAFDIAPPPHVAFAMPWLVGTLPLRGRLLTATGVAIQSPACCSWAHHGHGGGHHGPSPCTCESLSAAFLAPLLLGIPALQLLLLSALDVTFQSPVLCSWVQHGHGVWHQDPSPPAILKVCLPLFKHLFSAVGFIMGLVFGTMTRLLLRFMRYLGAGHDQEVALTLGMAYLAYWVTAIPCKGSGRLLLEEPATQSVTIMVERYDDIAWHGMICYGRV